MAIAQRIEHLRRRMSFRDGKVIMGVIALNSSGVATFTISTLSVGTHNITALYQGNSNFAPSTSPIVTQVVNAASISQSIVSPLAPAVLSVDMRKTGSIANTAVRSALAVLDTSLLGKTAKAQERALEARAQALASFTKSTPHTAAPDRAAPGLDAESLDRLFSGF